MARRVLVLLHLLPLLVVACRETTVSPAPSEVTSAALSRLPTKAAEKIARSRVPVLVPANDDLLARGVVMVEPMFYAFAAAVDGVNVSVQGTRFEHASGNVAPFERKDTLRGHPAIVTETDAIWTASWTENGFAYVVSVECARAEDARCQSKAFVRDLVDRLVFVGGAP
jgi:hypothetical protein